MTDPPTDAQPALTAEDQAKAQQVAVAGASAAISSPPAERDAAVRKAVRAEAKRVDAPFTEAQLEELAEKVAEVTSARTIDQLAARGAFDSLPEPVSPPAPTEAPLPPADAPGAQPPPVTPQPPQKRTFAHRFMGIQ